MDNCLFVVNPEQEDSNQNGIGDACEDIGKKIGIFITIDKLEGIAPVTTTFTAMTAGPEIKEISRDFGDGYQGKGNPIIHTFLSPGTYHVQSTAISSADEAKAHMTVIIG